MNINRHELFANATEEEIKIINDEDLSSADEEQLAKIWYLITKKHYSLFNALSNYEFVFFWENMTLYETAQERTEEGYYGEIPNSLLHFIDFEKIARDFKMNGYEETIYGTFFAPWAD